MCVMPMSGEAADCRVIPLVALGSCKRESVEDTVQLITALLNVWELFRKKMLEKCKRRLGYIYRVGTDGCGKRRQSLTRMCNVRKDALPRELLQALEEMVLFDCYGGAHQITVDFDGRHMLKRLRFRLVFTLQGMALYPGGLKLHKASLQVPRDTHTHTRTKTPMCLPSNAYRHTHTLFFFSSTHIHTHSIY